MRLGLAYLRMRWCPPLFLSSTCILFPAFDDELKLVNEPCLLCLILVDEDIRLRQGKNIQVHYSSVAYNVLAAVQAKFQVSGDPNVDGLCFYFWKAL